MTDQFRRGERRDDAPEPNVPDLTTDDLERFAALSPCAQRKWLEEMHTLSVATVGLTPRKQDACAYIADMSEHLRQIAISNQTPFLAYLLELVFLEARANDVRKA